jgi:C1A family cysteine protease
MGRRFTREIPKQIPHGKYGWKPSTKKPENFYEVPHMALLPSMVDLTDKCPPVYDQSNLGSCTANATAALMQFLMQKNYGLNWMPSRLALYYWNRMQEHTINEDSGASLHDAIRSTVAYGVPHESLWPYDITKFTVKPDKPVWSDAYWHSIKSALAVQQNLNALKTRLATGYPVIFGFVVFSSFETQSVAKTGLMPMPKENEEQLGGHAVMAVGYNDATRKFKIRNSWGMQWGDLGYFYMPYEFILNPNYADDFWTATEFLRFKK